jgi:hypothetical protein
MSRTATTAVELTTLRVMAHPRRKAATDHRFATTRDVSAATRPAVHSQNIIRLRTMSLGRTRLGQRLDLLLEFIVLRHQLAVLQRTGTRRPCFLSLLKTVNCQERLRNFRRRLHTVGVHDHDSVHSRFPVLVPRPQPRLAGA